jgi:hypothetical protein
LPWKEEDLEDLVERREEVGVDEEERRRRNSWPSLERERIKNNELFWPITK